MKKLFYLLMLLALPLYSQVDTGQLVIKGSDGGTCTINVQGTYVGPTVIPTTTTVKLTANPVNISQGQNSTLSWTSTNASLADLEPGIGTVQPNGSIVVTPDKNTTYTITAYGINSATSSTTINVSSSVTPIANPSQDLCGNMQWLTGYSMWEVDFRDSTPQYLTFVPSKSGPIGFFKWYNSSGSHALWNACNNNSTCISWCGAPAQRYSANGKYANACPNGWNTFAQDCSLNHNYCYSGGTGAKFRITIMDSNQNVLAIIIADHTNITYGFAASQPVVAFDRIFNVIAGNRYTAKIENIDPNPSANFGSFDSYTPYNLFTADQIATNLTTTILGGKSNIGDAEYEATFNGSYETKWQPIFGLGYVDTSTGQPTGLCSSQGYK